MADDEKNVSVIEPTSDPLGVIKHVSSGKYIHPKGGKANPPDETELVVNNATNDWQSRLQFKYTSSNGYIKHVSSGKYIHPKGGQSNPLDETKLVLSSSTHNNMTWDILPDGRIKHRSSGKWWHPKGGSSNPDNETHMVLSGNCDNWENRLKWIITYPDGEGQLTDISFGDPSTVGDISTVFVGHMFVENNTNTQQTKSVSISKDFTKISNWSYTTGFEISNKISCGVDAGIKIGTELNITTQREISFGGSESESITVSAQDSITCEPNKKYKSTLTCKKSTVQIPYTAQIKFSDGIKTTKGIIETDNYFDTTFVTEEIDDD